MRALPTIDNNRPPWGEIGTVINGPQLYPSWPGSNNSAEWANGAIEGMTGLIPIFAGLRGITAEAFLRFGYIGGTGLGDIRIRLDVGPRANGEAAGAPNDAASTRVDTTITVATIAGTNAGDPFYESIGTFDIDTDDVVLLYNISRLGADGADTFNLAIGVQEVHFVPAA